MWLTQHLFAKCQHASTTPHCTQIEHLMVMRLLNHIALVNNTVYLNRLWASGQNLPRPLPLETLQLETPGIRPGIFCMPQMCSNPEHLKGKDASSKIMLVTNHLGLDWNFKRQYFFVFGQFTHCGIYMASMLVPVPIHLLRAPGYGGTKWMSSKTLAVSNFFLSEPPEPEEQLSE